MTTTHRIARRIFVGALASVALLAAVSGGIAAQTAAAPQDKKPKVTVLDANRVYFPSVVPKGKKFTKPAVLATSSVYAKIPEWIQIQRKGLTEKDAEYHLLLEAATKRFTKAVRSVHHSGGFDIIAEVGAIKCENCTAKDVTALVIAALPQST